MYADALFHGAVELAQVGFTGQSGWFVPVDSLSNVSLPTMWSSDPAQQRATMLDFYRSLTLLDHSNRLGGMMRSDEFVAHDLCADGAFFHAAHPSSEVNR